MRLLFLATIIHLGGFGVVVAQKSLLSSDSLLTTVTETATLLPIPISTSWPTEPDVLPIIPIPNDSPRNKSILASASTSDLPDTGYVIRVVGLPTPKFLAADEDSQGRLKADSYEEVQLFRFTPEGYLSHNGSIAVAGGSPFLSAMFLVDPDSDYDSSFHPLSFSLHADGAISVRNNAPEAQDASTLQVCNYTSLGVDENYITIGKELYQGDPPTTCTAVTLRALPLGLVTPPSPQTSESKSSITSITTELRSSYGPSSTSSSESATSPLTTPEVLPSVNASSFPSSVILSISYLNTSSLELSESTSHTSYISNSIIPTGTGTNVSEYPVGYPTGTALSPSQSEFSSSLATGYVQNSTILPESVPLNYTVSPTGSLIYTGVSPTNETIIYPTSASPTISAFNESSSLITGYPTAPPVSASPTPTNSTNASLNFTSTSIYTLNESSVFLTGYVTAPTEVTSAGVNTSLLMNTTLPNPLISGGSGSLLTGYLTAPTAASLTLNSTAFSVNLTSPTLPLGSGSSYIVSTGYLPAPTVGSLVSGNATLSQINTTFPTGILVSGSLGINLTGYLTTPTAASISSPNETISLTNSTFPTSLLALGSSGIQPTGYLTAPTPASIVSNNGTLSINSTFLTAPLLSAGSGTLPTEYPTATNVAGIASGNATVSSVNSTGLVQTVSSNSSGVLPTGYQPSPLASSGFSWPGSTAIANFTSATLVAPQPNSTIAGYVTAPSESLGTAAGSNSTTAQFNLTQSTAPYVTAPSSFPTGYSANISTILSQSNSTLFGNSTTSSLLFPTASSAASITGSQGLNNYTIPTNSTLFPTIISTNSSVLPTGYSASVTISSNQVNLTTSINSTLSSALFPTATGYSGSVSIILSSNLTATLSINSTFIPTGYSATISSSPGQYNSTFANATLSSLSATGPFTRPSIFINGSETSGLVTATSVPLSGGPQATTGFPTASSEWFAYLNSSTLVNATAAYPTAPTAYPPAPPSFYNVSDTELWDRYRNSAIAPTAYSTTYPTAYPTAYPTSPISFNESWRNSSSLILNTTSALTSLDLTSTSGSEIGYPTNPSAVGTNSTILPTGYTVNSTVLSTNGSAYSGMLPTSSSNSSNSNLLPTGYTTGINNVSTTTGENSTILPTTFPANTSVPLALNFTNSSLILTATAASISGIPTSISTNATIFPTGYLSNLNNMSTSAFSPSGILPTLSLANISTGSGFLPTGYLQNYTSVPSLTASNSVLLRITGSNESSLVPTGTSPNSSTLFAGSSGIISAMVTSPPVNISILSTGVSNGTGVIATSIWSNSSSIIGSLNSGGLIPTSTLNVTIAPTSSFNISGFVTGTIGNLSTTATTISFNSSVLSTGSLYSSGIIATSTSTNTTVLSTGSSGNYSVQASNWSNSSIIATGVISNSTATATSAWLNSTSVASGYLTNGFLATSNHSLVATGHMAGVSAGPSISIVNVNVTVTYVTTLRANFSMSPSGYGSPVSAAPPLSTNLSGSNSSAPGTFPGTALTELPRQGYSLNSTSIWLNGTAEGFATGATGASGTAPIAGTGITSYLATGVALLSSSANITELFGVSTNTTSLQGSVTGVPNNSSVFNSGNSTITAPTGGTQVTQVPTTQNDTISSSNISTPILLGLTQTGSAAASDATTFQPSSVGWNETSLLAHPSSEPSLVSNSSIISDNIATATYWRVGSVTASETSPVSSTSVNSSAPTPTNQFNNFHIRIDGLPETRYAGVDPFLESDAPVSSVESSGASLFNLTSDGYISRRGGFWSARTSADGSSFIQLSPDRSLIKRSGNIRVPFHLNDNMTLTVREDSSLATDINVCRHAEGFASYIRLGDGPVLKNLTCEPVTLTLVPLPGPVIEDKILSESVAMRLLPTSDPLVSEIQSEISRVISSASSAPSLGITGLPSSNASTPTATAFPILTTGIGDAPTVQSTAILTFSTSTRGPLIGNSTDLNFTTSARSALRAANISASTPSTGNPFKIRITGSGSPSYLAAKSYILASRDGDASIFELNGQGQLTSGGKVAVSTPFDPSYIEMINPNDISGKRVLFPVKWNINDDQSLSARMEGSGTSSVQMPDAVVSLLGQYLMLGTSVKSGNQNVILKAVPVDTVTAGLATPKPLGYGTGHE